MKRLLVVGNGSLGLWWSFQLSRLANESLYKTFLLTRTEESAQVINKKGIVVEDKTSASTYCISCPSFSNVKQFYEKLQGHADILLLCVKQYHLKSALENCFDLLSPKGMAISFCNGVGNLETVASIVGDHRAAAAVTYEALQRVDTRQVIHWSSGKTILADTLTDDSSDLNAHIHFLYQVLKQQNLPVEWMKPIDARKEIWRKLSVNCVINPLATIARCRNGLLVEKIPQSLFEAICWEIVWTAERNGITLEHHDLVTRVLQTIQDSSYNICSTLQDIQNGRPTEIDAFNE